ncbi:His-Xaa-Ser system protein HxsD [Ectopseudomonas mendocina]|uniref:His-Xaa-Ser system protein HxsD n=1 Tax=Ectopseudomonas mendocina TaxID=300 RepID=A0ABZ2RGB2_ECTME
MTSVFLSFDEKLYNPESIQKAAYRGQHAFTLSLCAQGGALTCELLANITTSEEAFRVAVEEFRKDVLDYQLRIKLQEQTANIRNMILGVAFSNSGLIQ